MSYFKHHTAEVNINSKIGQGCKVWNNAQVRENVTIGTNCIIGTNVYVDFDVRIGNNVKIQNSVNIYHGVTIEDDVFVGPSVTFTNDMYPRSFNNNWVVSSTLVKKGASIGANSTIVCGITIGKYSMIGAGSVVKNDVNDYELLAGNPARIIGYVCKCGTKLDKHFYCNKCGIQYEYYKNTVRIEQVKS